MVGGTGLYIKAFCEGLDEIPEIDITVRNEIRKKYSEKTLIHLNLPFTGGAKLNQVNG